MVNGPKWKPILKVDQCGSVKEALCLKKHYLFIYLFICNMKNNLYNFIAECYKKNILYILTTQNYVKCFYCLKLCKEVIYKLFNIFLITRSYIKRLIL